MFRNTGFSQTSLLSVFHREKVPSSLKGGEEALRETRITNRGPLDVLRLCLSSIQVKRHLHSPPRCCSRSAAAVCTSARLSLLISPTHMPITCCNEDGAAMPPNETNAEVSSLTRLSRNAHTFPLAPSILWYFPNFWKHWHWIQLNQFFIW